MSVPNRLSILLTMLLTTVATAVVRDPPPEPLTIGYVPPALPVGEWIGDAPDTAGKKTKLVLFWEPSLQGSRMAMPILSKLQQRWGNDRLQVLGYGVERRPVNYNEDPVPTVRPFVIKQSTRIKFPVASVKEGDMTRTWLRKRQPPFLLLVAIGPQGAVQGLMSPLDPKLHELVAKLVTGRYDVTAEEWAAPYRVEIENYRRSRDWTQYRAVVDRMSARGRGTQLYFVDEELDFLVSTLTEQNDPEFAASMVQKWVMEYSDVDPDFLGMVAERLANDPSIPDDRRMLDAAAVAAKISFDSAETSEDRARALGRMAIVSTRQGKHDVARQQAKKAYRIAPPNIKSELKERWLYVKQNTGNAA